MARLKLPDYGLKMIPVDFQLQVLPGTFESAMVQLIDHELDLTPLRGRIANDARGARAFDPAVLLKIVLLGYSRGLLSSRALARACQENVLFMAVSGDTAPHFTTLAAFVSEMGDEIAQLFSGVLTVCDRAGLIGRELFAIDGVKLPSNASKSRSGKRADFARQADKMESAVEQILQRHRAEDGDSAKQVDERQRKRDDRRAARLKREAEACRAWLKAHPTDRVGPSGGERLSNLTDNESAKMSTDKGVIQGYCGVAAVDSKHQIVVEAQAHGTGSEQELLMPVVNGCAGLRGSDTSICADAGYHSEANLEALAEAKVQAWICDKDYRQRDPRYAGQERHKAKPDPLHDKSGQPGKLNLFKTSDFKPSEDGGHCICPAGKRLYRNGGECTINGYAGTKYSGAKGDCGSCGLRSRCLRKPDVTAVRQVSFFRGKRSGPSHTDRMKERIDTVEGKRMIAARFATVEPVFGNLRGNKRLNRFTLRGQQKVDGQWKLFCMVHNIEKLGNSGWGTE
jgi:transposase